MKTLTLFDAYCLDLRHAMDVLCYYSSEAASRAAALNSGYKVGSVVTLYNGEKARIISDE